MIPRVHLSSAICVAVGIAIATVYAGALLKMGRARRAPDLGRVSSGWLADRRASKLNGAAAPFQFQVIARSDTLRPNACRSAKRTGLLIRARSRYSSPDIWDLDEPHTFCRRRLN